MTHCVYKLQPRENYDRGFPLIDACILDQQGHAQRSGLWHQRNDCYHDPYYQRHVIGTPIVHKVDEDGRIHSEANYAVFRTKLDKESTVFNVGRYIDTLVHTPEGFKFAERLCIFDSEMIPNSIIYPI